MTRGLFEQLGCAALGARNAFRDSAYVRGWTERALGVADDASGVATPAGEVRAWIMSESVSKAEKS